MDISHTDKSESELNLEESFENFKIYAEPVLKLVEKELYKLYASNVKLKMKNKSLKKKINKLHKRPSLDLDTLRTSIFKRRSLNINPKNSLLDPEEHVVYNDSSGENTVPSNIVITTAAQNSDPKYNNQPSKLLQKSRTIANRLGLDNKSPNYDVSLYSLLKNHNDIIWNTNTDMFPNNKYLLFSCSADCSCKISLMDDSNIIEPVLIYKGHNSSVNDMSYNIKTPGLICTGSGDGSIHLWSYRSLYDTMVGDEDNTTITSGTVNDIISKSVIKELNSPLINIKSHELPISSVEWNRNGVNFLSASWDENIKIWDSDKQQCIQQLHGHNNEVTTAHYGTAENCVISGSADQTIRIWDLRTPNASVKICHAHSNVVTSVNSFHYNNYLMVSSGKDKILRIWDQRNLSQYIYSNKFGSPLNKISLSANDEIICIPEDNGHIWFCDSKLHRLCQITNVTKKRLKTSVTCCTWIDHSSNITINDDNNNKIYLELITADSTGNVYRWKTNYPNKIDHID